MRNGNVLKSRVIEICIKRIRANQGVGLPKFKEMIRISELVSYSSHVYLDLNQKI